MQYKLLGKTAIKSAEGKYLAIRAVWPFNFFPDTITLDEEKLEIIKRGFLTRKLVTVRLPDLFNVEVLEAPLFSTVRVIGKYVTGGHEDVPFVRKKDANELHRKTMELLAEQKPTSDQLGGQ